jgi:hypothetical protein
MELYIQMGHGMQSLSLEILESLPGTTLILSPVNIKPQNLPVFANRYKKAGGKIMFDPQLYFPRDSHKTLCLYDYWPCENITTAEQDGFRNQIQILKKINADLETDYFILPSSHCKSIDKNWIERTKKSVDIGQSLNLSKDVFQTLSLGKTVLSEEQSVEIILSAFEQWEIYGVYLVFERPENNYLIDQPIYLVNLISLVSGLKKQGKKVVVGYSNHQLLYLALAKCDGIATGNFLNVRAFKPQRFVTNDDDAISRRRLWYYCPNALSEYKIPFLDIAQRQNKLDLMAPSPYMANAYSSVLFQGVLPSSTGYSEKDSHMHYLFCLGKQCEQAVKQSYEKTKNALEVQLNTAEQLLLSFNSSAINGQNRDFTDFIDINRAAIATFDMESGFSMRQEWNNL